MAALLLFLISIFLFILKGKQWPVWIPAIFAGIYMAGGDVQHVPTYLSNMWHDGYQAFFA
jgi:hypothetical protein